MTPEEQQQQMAAMMFLEAQIGNIAREGAARAVLAESFAIRLKAAEARIAELEKAAAPQDNVVPIKEPA